ncbi:MAG TPA: hypothetical protein VHL05_14505 [Terriglobales bacterium]|jgi:Flp pilus assembly pilin Flp|nr:hypothetical protein [Terriglobales bacterium]
MQLLKRQETPTQRDELTEFVGGNRLAIFPDSVGKSTEKDTPMGSFWCVLKDDRGQDIAEYAVMLAVILVLVVGTIRLVGSNANNTFSSVASSVQ